ncbi:hypothetical protein JCM15765_31460 [Paradesulfitobacterium aromaticivorans]
MISDLSKWRLEKAETTFRDGEELERLGSYHSAINRYYYATFHAVRALLATKVSRFCKTFRRNIEF